MMPYGPQMPPPDQMLAIVQQGSPMLVEGMGRILGLGIDEQRAIAEGTFPTWGWVLLGAAALGGGTLLYFRYRDQLPFRKAPKAPSAAPVRRRKVTP